MGRSNRKGHAWQDGSAHSPRSREGKRKSPVRKTHEALSASALSTPLQQRFHMIGSLLAVFVQEGLAPNVQNGFFLAYKSTRRSHVRPPSWKGRRSLRIWSFPGAFAKRGSGTQQASSDVGTADGIRTHDLQSRSLALYPAELRPRIFRQIRLLPLRRFFVIMPVTDQPLRIIAKFRRKGKCCL